MSWRCFLFGHKIKPTKSFSGEFSKDDPASPGNRIKFTREIWIGYKCSRCDDRTITKVYDMVDHPRINQEAFDWVNTGEKEAKRSKLLSLLRDK